MIALESQPAEALKSLLSTDAAAEGVYADVPGWLAGVASIGGVETSLPANGYSSNGVDGRHNHESAMPACVIIAGGLDRVVLAKDIASVRRQFPHLPVVALAESPPMDLAVAAMKQGATDVLSLTNDESGLRARLLEAIQQGLKTAAVSVDLVRHRRNIVTLTQAERDVLEAMLVGMANKQIAQALEIGLRTVELRRSKIMRKMEAKSLAELVKFVCLAEGIASINSTDASATVV